MTLDDFQKKIVRDIADGKVKDIYSFVKSGRLRVLSGIKKEKAYHNPDGLLIPDYTTVAKGSDDDELFEQFKIFISIWNYLEEIRMIQVFTLRTDYSRVLYFVKQDGTEFDRLMSLIWGRYSREIVPLPPLKDFVARDFQTEDEFQHNEERKRWDEEAKDRTHALEMEKQDRKRSMRLTMIVAISSIALGIGGVVFNYVTYKTEREVIIKNSHAFPDTLTVRLANPSVSTIMDTVKQAIPNAKTLKVNR